MIQQVETTFRDYMRVLFRQKAVVITCFLTVMITVILGIMLKTPVYEAKVKMLISASKQVEATYYRDLLLGQNMEVTLTQAEIVKSAPVLEKAIRALGLAQKPFDYEKQFASPLRAAIVGMQARMSRARIENLPEQQRAMFQVRMAMEDLSRTINVEPIRDTNMFTISARDFSPVGAAIIANVISRSYVIFDLEQQVAELQLKYGEKHATVIQLKEFIMKMERALNGQPLPNIDAIGPASVKVIEQANVPLLPVGPSPLLIFILAFFMSIFLGIMLAFMFEYMDQTFKSPQDVEAYLNTPYLGAVPKRAKQKQLSYDNLAEQVLLISKDHKLRTLMFTTAETSDDAANIVVNLGKILAEKGHKVLVVDANFRQLTFKKFFNLEKGPGLVDVIEEKVTFEKSVHSAAKNLAVLAAGDTQLNPLTIVESNKMHELLAQAGDKYDLVLIAAPDLKHRDSILLAAQTDGVILVVNEGQTRKQVVLTSLEPVIAKKANILGVILNNRTYSIPKAIYDRV